MLDKELNKLIKTKRIYQPSTTFFKLVNKYFWKSLVGPIFSIFVPLFFMIIIYMISISKGRPYTFVNSYACFLVLTIFPIAFFSMMANNFDFKKSIILRKLRIEQFTKWKYLLILLSYYLMIIIIFSLLTTLIFLLFCLNPRRFLVIENEKVKISITFLDILKNFNVLSLIFSIIILIFMSLSFSLFISVFVKNSIITQFAGFGIIMTTLILSGQIFPLDQWVEVTFLKYLTFINPMGYPINLMNISTVLTTQPEMNNIFNFKLDVILLTFKETDVVYYSWSKPIFIFVPIVLFSLLLFFAIKKFDWNYR